MPGKTLRRVQIMARMEGEPSNALFEELERWNDVLSAEENRLPDDLKQPRALIRKGPSL
ncbi:hypothetical protein [Oceaniradius stylonematis]|uniref:hypothetical protein n=1 Tax=Oceaniradius stylonematis TaxID=2184161 RepID=UPI0035CEA6CF